MAVVLAILLLLFGVPWWTLLSSGTAWPTAVVVAGTLVFAAAFVGLPCDDAVRAWPQTSRLGGRRR